jgi:WD40 repeat protein
MKPLGAIHTVRWQRASTRTHVVLDYFTQHLPPSLSPPQKNFTPTSFQVCNLVWSKNVNELVSTHGYSQNQIILWRYPTMSKVLKSVYL